ncbi:MAG: alpha/beta hydrolase [Cryobacterium sp.]
MSTVSPTSRRAAARPSSRTQYCPFPIKADPGQFGLTTSSLALGAGRVVVRHGRRTDSDTATILLHGAAGSWSTWTPLLSAADDATSPSDLIIPDLPGWGDSPEPSGEEPLTIEGMARLVAEIALALGYRRWVVIGHSMGGLVALELAAVAARETTFVGLVSATTFSVVESARHPVTRFALLPGYAALLHVMRVLSLAGAAGTGFVRGLERMSLLRPLVSPLFSRPRLISASVVAALAAEARPRAFSLASSLAAAYDPERSWSRIRCPVRAQKGDSDVFVAESDGARLGHVIPDFICETLDDTGHFGHIERPWETLRLLPVDQRGRLPLLLL